MDVYGQFGLPPPPPPGPFSLWSGVNRARLPELTTVAQVSDFVDKLTVYQHSDAFQAQYLFGIGYLTLLLCIAMAIFYRKLRRRSWWIFRSVVRNQGVQLLPNVHNVWALGTGIYALVCIAGYTTEYIYFKKVEPVPHLTLWIALQWTPLSFACAWQAWGIFSASKPRIKSKARLPPMLTKPSVTNAIWLCMPFAQFLTVLVPGMLSDIHQERARHARAEWRAQYGGNDVLSREMLLDVIAIWNDILRSFHYLCVCMCLWATYTLFLFLLYTIVSWKLIAQLRHHLHVLRRRRTTSTFERTHSLHHVPFTDRWRSLASVPTPGSPAAPSTLVDPTSPHFSTELDGEKSTFSSTSAFAFAPTRSVKILASDTGKTTKSKDPSEIRSKLFSKSEQKNDRSVSFFPSVTPSATLPRQPLRADSQAQRVLRYFMIQSISVSCGIVCLCAIPIALAVTLYSAAEFCEIERYEGAAYVAASWITFIFGTTTMFSIAHATFETSFSQLLHHADAEENEDEDNDDYGDDSVQTDSHQPAILCPRPPPIVLVRRGREGVHGPQDDTVAGEVAPPTDAGLRVEGVLAPEDFTPRTRFGSERRTSSRPSSTRREWIAATDQGGADSISDAHSRISRNTKRTSFDMLDSMPSPAPPPQRFHTGEVGDPWRRDAPPAGIEGSTGLPVSSPTFGLRIS
ncbi:hypothetical protein OC834_006411 [Tilletia horrida]|uniref:Uncharacterized protein n=1 Tax=Tilletia horrida TaxID=155126 RepID=A0AAN6GB98_9BASI|nr:hypothetical protein OC834_006411 [Tilletia horrida]KAK0531734.1 hypothetical protein OC842_003518 [Tilletia horrida]